MGMQGEACTFRTPSTYQTPKMGTTPWKNRRPWPRKDLFLKKILPYIWYITQVLLSTHICKCLDPEGSVLSETSGGEYTHPFKPLFTSGTVFNSPSVNKSFLLSWTAWAAGQNMCYMKGGKYLIFLCTVLAVTHGCLCSIIWTFCEHPLMSPSANAAQFSSTCERTDQNLIFLLEL